MSLSERVRVCSLYDDLATVAERWRSQYFRNGVWGSTIYGPAEETYLKLLAVKTIDDLDALGMRHRIGERCDLCGSEPVHWLEVGGEPDYDARWLCLCLPCAAHLAAIAMEARQGGDGETRLHPKDDSAGRRHRPTTVAQPDNKHG